MVNCDISKASILEYKPVKNCLDCKCTIGIPIKSNEPMKEFSFCGKYRFMYLRDSDLMYMDGPDTYVRLMDFEERVGIVRHNSAGYIFSFQNQTFIPDTWQHICLMISADIITIILNGEVVFDKSYETKMDFLETNLWLGGGNVPNWMHRRFEGKMTDVNLWNEPLTINDLISITTGNKQTESISAPALFEWNIWKLEENNPCVEYQILNENDYLFKETYKQQEILLIEYMTTFESAYLYCKAFGGNFLVPQNDNEMKKVQSLLKESDNCQPKCAFLGLKKINAENLVDHDGNITAFVNWSPFEPNGNEYEECINMYDDTGKFNDVNCWNKFCFTCRMAIRHIYCLRGNISIGIDRHYTVTMTGKETEIRGIKETKCIWNKTWHFGSNLKQDTEFGNIMPPVGVQNWNNGQKLKFSQCHVDEFTCHTYGYCISMNKRCDGDQDCKDGSDERNCMIMTLQDGYNKKYPGTKNTTVTLAMDIYDIANIDELEMAYTVHLRIKMIWYDPRITFRNLKMNKDEINLLSIEEIGKIWSPQLKFVDSNEIGVVEAGDQVPTGVFTEKGTVTILRNGDHQNNALVELDEDYLYPGNENALLMTNHLVVRLGCRFELQLYPFDTQICPIKLIKKLKYESQFVLKWEKNPKINKIELLQYEVWDNLQYNDTDSTQNEIEVYIRLQRKLWNHLISTYIPTLCLITITGLTLFINLETDFKTSITVALTSMLVMYTLHQSISRNLPTTDYMKMIDIWLFGGLIGPFIVIVILIIINNLIMRETNEVIDMRKEGSRNKWDSKCCLKAMQILFPLMIGIFVGIYWIIGLVVYTIHRF